MRRGVCVRVRLCVCFYSLKQRIFLGLYVTVWRSKPHVVGNGYEIEASQEWWS